MDEKLEISEENKIKVLEMEIFSWNNTSYQYEVRSRAARLSGNIEIEKNAMKDLESSLKMIDELKKELQKLKNGNKL